MTIETNALIGRRVRAIRFAVGPYDQPNTTDPETGLIRHDVTGNVLGVDDNVTVPPGTEGTVEHIDDAGTIRVAWDTGSHIGLIAGADAWDFA